MEKLIEQCEKEYKELNTIQMLLVNSTKDNDEEGRIYAIGRLINEMTNIIQFLKSLIEHKNNIIDKHEAYHDNKVFPDGTRRIIAIKTNGEGIIGWYNGKGVYKNDMLSSRSETPHWGSISKWAYLDDLLPTNIVR